MSKTISTFQQQLRFVLNPLMELRPLFNSFEPELLRYYTLIKRLEESIPACSFKQFFPQFPSTHRGWLAYISLALKPDLSRFQDEDRWTLNSYLERYELQEKYVDGDGNCQFRALADQILKDQNRHGEVRSKVIGWLSNNPDFCINSSKLSDFIDTDAYPDWSAYVKEMGRNGAWGDHLTLVAAAEVYKAKIIVVSTINFKEIEIEPSNPNAQGRIDKALVRLLHRFEFHYSSLIKKDSI
eukprot:TRINITY_DN4657_c0_g1_i1.p1 TRINITY_DN4657_c0_g1~~TRINITY_DN4657_c0_g1_i1.p1  ORF type:complete len:255 (+),score=27.42 TRINITY_DN4657_c0_g1_i1:46-765(+)